MSLIILQQQPVFKGFLDIVAGMGYLPTAAFSVRRLWGRYRGPCCRVLRASDSLEMDIPFCEKGWMCRSTLSDFCQGTTGTVSVWYDQSGKGTNATQGAAATQFVAFESGAVSQWSNRGRSPAYRLVIGSGDWMSFDDSNLASGANPSTTIAVERQSIISGVRNVWGYGTIAASASRQQACTNATNPRISNGTTVTNTATSCSNLKVITILRFLDAATMDERVTLGYNNTETATTGLATTNTILAGASGGLIWRAPAGGSSSAAAGFISELIHFNGYIPDAHAAYIEDQLQYIWNFNA